MNIELQRIDSGFNGEFCYTHAHAVMTPEGFAVITMQPLRLSGSDNSVFIAKIRFDE